MFLYNLRQKRIKVAGAVGLLKLIRLPYRQVYQGNDHCIMHILIHFEGALPLTLQSWGGLYPAFPRH